MPHLLFTNCTTDGTYSSNSNSGKVVAVIDGDTFDILLNGKEKVRIRMAAIDAPERGMPFYKVSKKYLSDLCFQKTVRFKQTDTDGNDRIVAFSYLEDGTELSYEMIKTGMAWHFKKYSSDSILSALEVEARNAKRGLWIDENPISPSEIRSLHRQGISTKDSLLIKEGQE